MRCKDCEYWKTEGVKSVVRLKEIGPERFGTCQSGQAKTSKGVEGSTLVIYSGQKIKTHGSFGCTLFSQA